MAMPPRDDTIEAIKLLDALLEYAVMHNDEAEAEKDARNSRCGLWADEAPINPYQWRKAK
jgi:hypothetical protein